MKQILKDELKRQYEAPPPPGKREFFRWMKPRPVNAGYLLMVQISYISGLEWTLSVILFGVIFVMNFFFKPAVLSAVLALMPFLAVAGVSESMRSVIYGMEELEMSARFSLKSVILARMGITGIENLILALTAALFIQGKFLQTVLYLLVPYLVTVYGSLFIVRSISGKDGIYVCMAFSAAVSLAAGFSSINYRWIYQEQFNWLWLAAVAALIYMDCRESRRFINTMEYC